MIDDSALVRSLLTEIINKQPDMEAIGAAPDPLVAREMIRATESRRARRSTSRCRSMDGLDFLERLMRLRPTPVVMVSTLTERGAETTHPRAGAGRDRLRRQAQARHRRRPRTTLGARHLREDPRRLARAHAPARAACRRDRGGTAPQPRAGGAEARWRYSRCRPRSSIIIGASTGGTEAIREVLTQPAARFAGGADHPAHAARLHHAASRSGSTRCASITVSEAVDGERVLPGHAYIAPGDRHLKLARSGANYLVALDDGPPVNRHRPSVEVLFKSAAQLAGPNALGVMLTGMGKDGATAMLEMKQAGALQPGAGRSQLRGLRHAEGGDRRRRGATKCCR
ncbi:MAG: chemotaxis response regulator protein-glutamate methylesterase [Comamonadaceae bacterium]|nr:chemotaxis response regulator protein-glutamate methylesterase [Comamonadaceae bacterium]